MAERYVYESLLGTPYVRPVATEFEWLSGFSAAQKRRSIRSLHDAYLARHPGKRVLEISSKSEKSLGVALSAFNLTLPIDGQDVPVECAFQAGKVFEHGGPFTDLLSVTPREAKRDSRLKESGRLVSFSLLGQDFSLNTNDAYYRWLYLNGLMHHPELTEQLMEYDAFTDIEFNPKRQVNCQAVAAAAYVSLAREGTLEEAMSDCASFVRVLYGIRK